MQDSPASCHVMQPPLPRCVCTPPLSVCLSLCRAREGGGGRGRGGGGGGGFIDREEEEEESLFKADAVNEEDPERDRATQV